MATRLILNDQGSVDAFTTLQQLWQDELLAQESLQSKFDTDVDYLRGETAWMAQNWPFTSATFADQGILERVHRLRGLGGSGPAGTRDRRRGAWHPEGRIGAGT